MGKSPAKAKRGIPSKSENFNEWYPFIVEASIWSIRGIQSREWMFGDHMAGRQ